MTIGEIVTACIGMTLCIVIFAMVGVVIAGIFWHLIIKKADFAEMEIEEWEEESWK